MFSRRASAKLKLFAFLSATLVGWALSEAEARPARPFYQASRALAMGDAYTAVGTDFEAVYYNPAGIAKRNRPKLKILDLETTVSQGFVSLFDGSLTKFLNMGEVLSDVADNPGKPYTLGVAVLPQFLIRNFSFGVLIRAQTEATYDANTTNTSMYSFADLGGYIHYGVALGGGVVKLGVGGKILNRAELERDYTAAQISAASLQFQNQWQEGLGLGWDAGVLLTLPVTSLPTLGVSVQDIGNTRFADKRIFFTSDAAPAGAPQTLEQKINTGYSMVFKHGRGSRSVVAFDLKDVSHMGTSYLDHFHAGWEFNYADRFYLRAGVNQGRYWTAGFGLSLGGLGLEFGSHGENIAPRGAARVADRKYVGRYVLAF